MNDTPHHGDDVPDEGERNRHAPASETVGNLSDGTDDRGDSDAIRGTRAGQEDEVVVRESATTPRTRRGASESPADDRYQ